MKPIQMPQDLNEHRQRSRKSLTAVAPHAVEHRRVLATCTPCICRYKSNSKCEIPATTKSADVEEDVEESDIVKDNKL